MRKCHNYDIKSIFILSYNFYEIEITVFLKLQFFNHFIFIAYALVQGLTSVQRAKLNNNYIYEKQITEEKNANFVIGVNVKFILL